MRPTTPRPVFEKIPLALREQANWVLWQYEERDGRWTKVPKTVGGSNASATDPTTWSSFETVRTAFGPPYDGVGFMLQGSGFTAVDLDHVIEGQRLHEEASRIVQALATYTEVSPSGEGIRILLRGALPAGWRKTTKYLVPIEMYDDVRYVTITGRHCQGTPTTVEDRGIEIAALHGHIGASMPRPQMPTTPMTSVQPNGMDDMELLARAQSAKNGQKFQALWKGDTSAFNGDDSAADMALVNTLVFWSGRNVEQVDRLFRRSGLMREKWDSPRPGGTYGSVTIAKSIESGGDVYREVFEPITISEPAPEFTPIPKIAQCGIVHQYADTYAQASGVDYAYWYFSFLTTLLSAISQRVRVEHGLARPLRLWSVLIGPPNSGKSMARDITYNFFAALQGVAQTEMPLRRRNVSSDRGMLLANDGVRPMLLMPDEFTTLVKKSQIEGATLSETLLELFEKEDIDAFKDRSGVATMIHLSVLSGTTPALFRQHLDVIAAEGGLLSRLWLVPPTTAVQFKGFVAPASNVIEYLRGHTRHVITTAVALEGVLDVDAQAKRLLAEWMQGLGPAGMTGYAARIDGYARRLAAGFALMRVAGGTGSRAVAMVDMMAALGLCEWELEMRRQFIVDGSDSKSAKWTNAIRRFMRKAVTEADQENGVVRDTDIYRGVAAHRWGDPGLFRRLMEALESNREIERVSVPGRTPQRPMVGWRIGEAGLMLDGEPAPTPRLYTTG